MKISKLRLPVICLSLLLTLSISHAAALACADIDAGSNVYGTWDCRFDWSGQVLVLLRLHV